MEPNGDADRKFIRMAGDDRKSACGRTPLQCSPRRVCHAQLVDAGFAALSPLAREVIKGSRRIHAEEKRDIGRVEFPIEEFRKYCVLNEGRLRTRMYAGQMSVGARFAMHAASKRVSLVQTAAFELGFTLVG